MASRSGQALQCWLQGSPRKYGDRHLGRYPLGAADEALQLNRHSAASAEGERSWQ